METFLTWTPTKANYVSKLIETITTITFYLKKNNKKWHSCTCFLVCFIFQPMAEPNQPNSWKRKCCHSTPYIFHDMIPTLFCCMENLIVHVFGMYPPIVALHSMEQSTIIAFSCKCHTVSLSYLCHVVTNRLRIFSMLTHDH